MAGHFERVTTTGGGTYEAYIAFPAKSPAGVAPGIVVLQEIFGLNDFVLGVVERLAQHNFFAIAPDLFWRQQPGVRLDSTKEPDRLRARQLLSQLDEHQAVLDAVAAMSHLRRRTPGCSGRVGALGYCLGGKLSYLMATRSDVDAAVSYYGVGIETVLDEVSASCAPSLLHFGASDQLCPPASQLNIQMALAPFPDRFRILTHEGCGHGFARIDGSNYDAVATARADEATLAFLNERLRK